MLPLPKPYIVALRGREFIPPRNYYLGVKNPMSLGGKGLYDTSEALNSYTWEMFNGAGGLFIRRSGEAAGKIIDLSTEVRWLDFCFDVNMNPTVTYVVNGEVYLRFFDTAIDGFSTINIPGARTPSICLDEYREYNISNATIILAYMKGSNLMCRFQHERFSVEHTLQEFTKKYMLWRVGIVKGNRVGFYVR